MSVASGQDWPDNAERFTVFARVAALLAQDALDLGWQPAVVHTHDWQTGLVAAFLADQPVRPKTVFTIHNLAYGGYFSHSDFLRLQLPGHWWSSDGAEFHGGFSMLKAGIVYADAVTTVSPTYAAEICTPEFGYGLDGLLLSMQYKLHGILNGIDTTIWNPSTDVHLPAHYSLGRILPGKRRNKQALLERFLPHADDAAMQAPLLGLVARLVEQKGIDWVLAAMPVLLAETDVCFVLLGSGQVAYEQKLARLAKQHPAAGVRRDRLRRAAGAPDRGRRGYVSDAVALRAVWPEPDVQPALRHAACRVQDRRAGRYRGRCERGHAR